MDLTEWTDMELVQLQAELRKYREDREQLYEGITRTRPAGKGQSKWRSVGPFTGNPELLGRSVSASHFSGYLPAPSDIG